MTVKFSTGDLAAFDIPDFAGQMAALSGVGFEVNASSANLGRDLLEAFKRLHSFYECGLKKGVKLK